MNEPYQLLCADTFDAMRSIANCSCDALITDPPYCSGGLTAGDKQRDPVRKYEQSGTRRVRPSFGGEQKDQRSWTAWTTEWLRMCHRALKDGAPIAVFIDWRQLPALTDAIQMADFIWRGIAVWDKTECARPVRGRPRNQCEFIVWGSKGAMPTGRSAPTIAGLHRQAVLQRDKHHLTGKPLSTMKWLCQLAPEKGLILDPFAGSGTTGVAALLSGRRFLGIEIEESYQQIALKRLDAARAGKVLEAHETLIKEQS